jgi:Family of unknown function (DUF6318)
VGVRVGVAVIAVVVAVAGCSGGGSSGAEVPPGSGPSQASSPPSNPPSTAATTSPPAPAAPTLPAAARPDTPTAATTFARYYMTVLDYATTTGDTTLLRTLADCPGCNALADGIDTLRREGGRTIGGKISVTKTTAANYVAGKAALVDLTYSRQARTIERASGAKQSVAAEKSTRLLVTLRRTRSWLITNAQPAT